MSIYAISDLHLSFNTNKPMDIFGWNNYEEKISQDWRTNVKEEDLVLLTGDFSWEMKLENTYKDFQFINNLPGKKLLLKGNHDLWWTTLKRMREFLKEKEFNNTSYVERIGYTGNEKKYVVPGTRSNGGEQRKNRSHNASVIWPETILKSAFVDNSHPTKVIN